LPADDVTRPPEYEMVTPPPCGAVVDAVAEPPELVGEPPELAAADGTVTGMDAEGVAAG
jgi:hypothetical protein